MKESLKFKLLILAWIGALLAVVIAIKIAPFECHDCTPWIYDIAWGLCLILLTTGTLWGALFVLREEYRLHFRNEENKERMKLALIEEIKQRYWFSEKQLDADIKKVEILDKLNKTLESLQQEPEIQKDDWLENILKDVSLIIGELKPKNEKTNG